MEHPSKRARTVPSIGKVMGSAFWVAHGILKVDYLQKGQTINGTYYASLLRKYKTQVPWKTQLRCIVHQDNAPVHKSIIVMAANLRTMMTLN